MKHKPNPEPQPTRQEFLASLFEAYKKARPLSFMRQWLPQDLLDAGIPRDWLEQNGLLPNEHREPKQQTYATQRQFAALVSKEFNQTTNQMAVSRAVRTEGLAAHVTKSNGRIHVSPALAWWKLNKSKSESEITSEAEYRRLRQKLGAEREGLELDVIRKKLSGDWKLTSITDYELESVGVIFRTTVNATIESYLRHAIEDVVNQTIRDTALAATLIEKLRPLFPAAFAEWQNAIKQRWDALVKDCDTRGKELQAAYDLK